MFARVVVLSPLNNTPGRDASFDYHVPPECAADLAIGSLVIVPFGHRRLYAIVVEQPKVPAVAKTRPIESVVDPVPVLAPSHIDLGRWLARTYFAPLHECLTAMLPPGVVGGADVLITLAQEVPPAHELTRAERRLVDLLAKRGPLRGGQIDHALPRRDWRATADRLVRRELVVRTPVLSEPRVSPKEIRTAALVDGVDIEARMDRLTSEFYPPILQMLCDVEHPIPVADIYEQTGASNYHLTKLAERGIVRLESSEVWRDPLADQVFTPSSPPPLTRDQATAWTAIREAMQGTGSAKFLLHGVTGSGKTEIYLRAVDEALGRGQRALVLVPEISLTPQTTHRFAARFPERVAVLHSALSDGERFDTWRRARAGLVDIVIGPRSALFSPVAPLGLIILDEEHEDSYKQEAPRPYYHARDTAMKLADLTGATLILGSATPSLESFYAAETGKLTLLTLPRRVLGHVRRLHDLQTRYHVPQIQYRHLEDEPIEAQYRPLPPVHIIDLRAELRAGNRTIFSRPLQEAMDKALDCDEQVILFLNRRGSATFILCRDCGHVMKCPRCDIPLTYHGHRSRLICHHCQHTEPQPQRCPECGSSRIRYFGLGTERVEDLVRDNWPGARLVRWDRDTAHSHGAHSTILQRFVDGTADIMVGTQMIAKGLDLPLVTVVGVISADTTLNLPDYRSAERTFQLVTQVAGRAGRGLLAGRVFVQTYHPEHYAITNAANHDYCTFAARELMFRRQQGYPPYRQLVRFVYEDRSASKAKAEAEALARGLRDVLSRLELPDTDLIGPAPAFFARRAGRYRWHLLLRHGDPATFLSSVPIPPGWRVDVNPASVL